ncbi:MAG: hypothetical protein PHU56_00630, partial [Candidatus Pacebacteria bacterium]|nr:hypothetical protein [Candidatus Paceibacterota bacterium]
EEKLDRQREAWAVCRTVTEEKIEANHDIPKEEMLGIVKQFASNYGFAERHIKTAEQSIDRYTEMRSRVVETREKYPDDIELVNKLTGVGFTEADKSDFTVGVGPMSFEISCSGSNAARIYEKAYEEAHGKSGKPIPKFEGGGFLFKSPGLESVLYIVINNDYAKYSRFYAATIPHEKQHYKDRVLSLSSKDSIRADAKKRLNRGMLGFLRHRVGEQLFGFERDFEDELWQRYESQKNQEEKAFLLGEYMRLRREHALNQAKEEIMAMKAEDLPRYNWHKSFFEQGPDSYDFLAYLRDHEEKKTDALWQETAERVLVNEYRKIILAAVAAFDDLENLGYTKAETIAILTDKRLPDWPKTVKRLAAQKQAKS